MNTNRLYDKIDVINDNPLSETEGLNQMKFKRDSMIHLTFVKKKKKKKNSSYPKYIINQFNSNHDITEIKTAIHKKKLKEIIKLIHEVNKKNHFIKYKGKLKLTPFQKFINKTNEDKKRIEEIIEKNNSPKNFMLKSMTKTIPKILNDNKYNTQLFKTPQKKLKGVISKINGLTFNTLNDSPVKTRYNQAQFKFILSNTRLEKSHHFITDSINSLNDSPFNTINVDNNKVNIHNLIKRNKKKFLNINNQ